MPASKQKPEVPPTELVKSSYLELTQASAHLNKASDSLTEAIAVLDAALQQLNLGISVWTELAAGGDDWSESWWDRSLGYAKVKDKWAIALRTRSGDSQQPDRDNESKWAFGESPRWLRLEAVDKIPDLLDALLKEARLTTEKLQKKAGLVLEFAAAMSPNKDKVPPAMDPFAGLAAVTGDALRALGVDANLQGSLASASLLSLPNDLSTALATNYAQPKKVK